MIFLVIKQFQKTSPDNMDTSVKENIERTQEFLPFKQIKDNMIDLGGNRYRVIIECSSINYDFKTKKEKEAIDISFMSFLNSLTFPITMYVQSRQIDNSKMLKQLETDIEQASQDYPSLKEYGEIYYDSLKYMRIENNIQKKKYIIIPFDEAVTMTNLNEEEKYEYALKEVEVRINLVRDAFSAIGIRTKQLSTKEIVELLYASFHREDFSYAEEIDNKEALSLLTQTENDPLEYFPNDARLDWILYEAAKKIQTDLAENPNVDENSKNDYNKAIFALEQLRNEVAGFYKEDTPLFVSDEDNKQLLF